VHLVGFTIGTLTKVWKVRGSNPGAAEIFRAPQTGGMALPAPCTKGTECFLKVNRPDSGADNPPSSSAEVTNSLELYHRFYSVPAPAGYVVTFTILRILSLLHFMYEFCAVPLQTKFFPSLIHYIKG
jgi:hypothetical protein